MESHRFRLSVMMFGQYLIMGAWVVTLATYLMAPPTRGGLNFSATDASWIYSTLAIAGILTPLITGVLADRLFRAERLMAFFHLVGSLLLYLAASLCESHHLGIEHRYRELAIAEVVDGIPLLETDQLKNRSELRLQIREAQQRINEDPEMHRLIRDAFYPLFGIMQLYAFCQLMTLTLSSVIALRNLNDSKRNFSRVRLWGTVGWIVTGISVEVGLKAISPMPLVLASALSLIMSIFCLYLPTTPPKGHGKSIGETLGIPALKLFTDRSFFVMVLCAFGIAITQQFYTIYSNRYLNELGAPLPAAIQTIAQFAEVATMVLFTLLIPRLGLKWMMVIGLFTLALRNGLFASEDTWIVICGGLPLHGISYAFFYITAAIYVDQKAPKDLRASAQGIYTFITMGAGTLLGNWLSGLVVESQTLGSEVAWISVWLVPTLMCLAISILFTCFFREDDHSNSVNNSNKN